MQLTLFFIGLIILIAFSIQLMQKPTWGHVLAFLGGLVTLLTSLEPFAADFDDWMFAPFAVLAVLALLLVLMKAEKDEPRKPGETLEEYHRRILINEIEKVWITENLEKSLHGLAMIELGISEDADAVGPWGVRDEASHDLLPAGMGIGEIFKQVGSERSLLILGAPGSGKTTMLLDLTRHLIASARENNGNPIPVVLNLSTWRSEKKGGMGALFGGGVKQTFEGWLVDELQRIYEASGVALKQIFLLLDGLDEIPEAERASCVEAINDFRESRGRMPIVICSRIKDYEEIGKKLDLKGAIFLEALDQGQVDEYLDRAGESLAGVKVALRDDPLLYELLESPLMLSVLSLAYQGSEAGSFSDLSTTGDKDERLKAQRKELFDRYIAHMFERPNREGITTYPRKKIERWLAFMAHQLRKEEEVAYNQHVLQPSWLGGTMWEKVYPIMMILLGASAMGLVFGLRFSTRVGLVVGGVLAVLFVINMQMMRRRGEDIKFEIDLKSAGWWIGGGLLVGMGGFLANSVSSTFLSAVVWGLIVGLISGVIGGQDEELSYRLFIGLFVGLIVGLGVWGGSWLNFWLFGDEIFRWLFVGVTIALIMGLISGLMLGLRDALNDALIVGLSIGLLVGLSGWLSVGLISGVISGVILGLISGVILGLIDGLSDGLIAGLRGGVILRLITGLVEGLGFGLLAYMQYGLVRGLLWLSGWLPLRLGRLLDDGVDLILMRRGADGHQFIHLLLRDHLADRWEG